MLSPTEVDRHRYVYCCILRKLKKPRAVLYCTPENVCDSVRGTVQYFQYRSSTVVAVPLFVGRLGSCPTSGERLIRGYTKFDFTVDDGKERLNPSRDKS